MGVAVILLTVVIRIILLPLSLAEEQSAEDRRELAHKLHELETVYSADPIRLRAERRQLFHRKPSIVIGELVSFFVQLTVSLMLWKMFDTGLKGEDVHLIYSFMPQVETPFNLVFMKHFDLTHPDFALNLMQSLMIFLVETVGILTSPYPPMKGEVVRLQLVLPIVSFLVFMFLPAGKKLFIITTLSISLLVLIYKFIRHRWQDFTAKKAVPIAPVEESPLVTTVGGDLPVQHH